MRGFKTLAFAATASVLLAGSLQAQWKGQVKWGGTYPGTGVTYKAIDNSRSWGTASSPYKANFRNVVTNGSSLAPDPLPATWYLPSSFVGSGTSWGPTADIFCVDLLHYANTNSNGYSANFTNLANIQDLGRTTRSNSQTKYLQAAYLAQKIKIAGVGSIASKDMTGAIWQIMSGIPLTRLVSGTTYDQTGIQGYVAEAGLAGNWGSVTASDWVVVTSRDANGGFNTPDQEYITQVTPEPATMLLLGTGLVVMLMAAGALRRPVA